ncbi:hypothetical protein N9W89_07880 [Hellea sp.]|nr:hypothetical protein [Hellea sp.]
MTTLSPPIATPVADVIKSYPARAQKYALDLRALIIDTAAREIITICIGRTLTYHLDK